MDLEETREPATTTNDAAEPQTQHPIAALGTNDDVSPPRGRPFPIVGIGASAGGLEALMALLRELPPDTGMAFIVVQHLDPNHRSELSEILQGATPMPVHTIENGMSIETNTVYVMPPNFEVLLKNGALILKKREQGLSMPVDTLFMSLATEQGARSIAVVLSGNDSDGAQGILAVKGECGVTFAQDEATARFTGMPRSAAATGAADFVLPPAEIAQELARIGRHPYVVSPHPDRADSEVLPDGDGELRRLFRLLQQTTAVDFTHYKQTTVRRRVGRRMVVHRLKTLHEYLAHVQRNPGELKELFRDLLIVVTGFFREPETFSQLQELLRTTIAPDRQEPIRVWVPGCATGEEVYSLAICLQEVLEQLRMSTALQMFGTDISDLALSRAREAIYSNIITQQVSPERLQRFFVKIDSGYQISKTIRETCIFARQDVTADPPFSHLDVLSCRNVLIYMDAELQRKVIPAFHYSLKEGGLLMLGAAEALSSFADLFEPVEKANKIFRRKHGPNRMTMSLNYARPESHAQAVNVTPAAFNSAELQRRVDRLIQQNYAPGAVVVDADFHILQFRGHTSRYLDPSPGDATLNLLRMAREDLVVALRRALRMAKEHGIGVREETTLTDANGKSMPLTIEITPIVGLGSRTPYLLVVFNESTPPAPPIEAPERDLELAPAELKGLNEQLRAELREIREQFRNLSEDHAAHLEELQASNEEVRSANEELQSTNEELGTTKEELQSANEELTTVNEELRNRNQELNALNNDLKNLLSTVNVPVLITDNLLRIRRFTQAAEKLLDLTAVDVGRLVTHIHGPFSPAEIARISRSALERLRTEEAEMRDERGKWYQVSARPYRTNDDRIDGVIISFIDIDALKRGLTAAEEARDYAEALVETVREPLVVLDSDLRIKRATSSFYETFQVTREETEGRFLYDLGNGQWNVPRLRELLGDALFRNTPFQELEIWHDFPVLGTRTMRINGRRIPLGEGEPRLVLMAIEDVTERKEAAEVQYRRLFETAKDGIIVVDARNDAVKDLNPHFIEMTGFSRERVVGKRIVELEPFSAMRVDELMKELKKQETARRDAVLLRDSKGHEKAVDIVANHYLVGSQQVIQLNIRDLSERRQAEAALRQSEERFRLFVNNVRDYALFLMDATGNIVSWNAGAERVLGYREEEILGRNAGIIFTPEDVETGEAQKELDRALRDGRSEDERWHIRKDGSRFWGSGVVTLVRDETGRLRGFAKIMRDQTERKRAEDELQAALREKELLLREIHHRVKNNLQVITSLLNIQAATASAEAQNSLEQMRDRVRAIARIHELLYKSRNLSAINMAEQAEALSSELLHVYGLDPFTIRVRISMDAIMADVDHAIPCGLMLNELISNSLKHALPKGRRGEITISMRREGDGWYCLSVADNGSGVPADVSVEEPKSVGLRLVNIFVDQLQGTIKLVRGEGARFEIRLPATGFTEQ